MKVMIFGGAGYVGQELVKKFAEQHHEIAVYDSFTNGDLTAHSKLVVLDNITIFKHSVTDAKIVEKCVDAFKPELVYNLAALHYIPYCIEHPQEVFDTNYLGLQNILSSLVKSPHIKFIFASSASVYGSQNEQCSIDTPVSPNDIYGASKLAGEYLIKYQYKNYVLMRLFNVYGELDPHPHLIPKVVKAAVNNESLNLGTATAKRDFIHVKDVANALYIARKSAAEETYNVASGTAYAVKDIVDKIYTMTNSTGNVSFDTAENMRENDASFLSGDASKLIQLGWRTTVSVDDGIITAIEAYRKLKYHQI